MKIKTTVYVYYSTYSWQETGEYQVMYAQLKDDEFRTFVCTREIELDIPDNYDPTAQKLAALQKEKEKAQEELRHTSTKTANKFTWVCLKQQNLHIKHIRKTHEVARPTL